MCATDIVFVTWVLGASPAPTAPTPTQAAPPVAPSAVRVMEFDFPDDVIVTECFPIPPRARARPLVHAPANFDRVLVHAVESRF